MVNSEKQQQNHLLAALSPDVIGRLSEYLEFVTLPLGSVVYESGDAMVRIPDHVDR